MFPPFIKNDVNNSRSSPSNNISTVNSREDYIPKQRKPSSSALFTTSNQHQPEMLSLELGPTTTTKRDSKSFKSKSSNNRKSFLYHSSTTTQQQLKNKWFKLFLIVVGLLFIFGYIPFFKFNSKSTRPYQHVNTHQPIQQNVERDQIILYRIIGNDLPPRHKEGQTLSNLQFILDHEPSFPNTKKIFLLNRIIDPVNEATIIRLLDSYHMEYIRVPFDQKEYEQLDFQLEKFPDADFLHSDDYRRYSKVSKLRALDYTYHVKNLYAMNNVSWCVVFCCRSGVLKIALSFLYRTVDVTQQFNMVVVYQMQNGLCLLMEIVIYLIMDLKKLDLNWINTEKIQNILLYQ